MENLSRGLQGVAASINTVQLPGVPAKGDVIDFLRDGLNSKEGLLEVVKASTNRSQDDRTFTAVGLLKEDIPPLLYAIQGIVPEGVSLLAPSL